MDIGRVDITLYNIEDGNITGRLGRRRRDHSIFWLQESAHYVQNSRLSNRLCLVDIVACKWSIGSHEEVAPRSGDERGHNPN